MKEKLQLFDIPCDESSENLKGANQILHLSIEDTNLITDQNKGNRITKEH